MNDENEKMMHHDADGIRELDNNLPLWWLWLFYLSIAFGGVYLVYYHVLKAGDLSAAEYRRDSEQGEKLKVAALSKFEASLDTLQPVKDGDVLEKGHQTFRTLCAPCHREDGGGLVGPNLCDDYWIHGPAFKDNLKVIMNGVPEKGMVTWKGILKPAEIHAVASYIYTLRGTKPPNPKPPENQAPKKEGPSAFE